jgi:hypothetical protein
VVALTRQHVGQVASLELQPELGAVAVTGIPDDRPRIQPPTTRLLITGDLVEHLQGLTPFLPMPHPVRDPAACPPGPDLCDRLGIVGVLGCGVIP